MKTKTIGLCEGRHEMPVSEFVYPQVIEDPTNTNALELTAFRFFHQADSEDVTEVYLYVTGMSVALAAFIKVAAEFGWIGLTLYHYNAKSGEYYPQMMW